MPCPSPPEPAPADPSADPSANTALADGLRLACTAGIGPVRGAALLTRFGSAGAALQAPRSALIAVLGSAGLADRLLADDPARAATVGRSLAWLAGGPGRSIRLLGDPDYPAALLVLHDPPLALFIDGDPQHLQDPQLAIVGSRNASAGGLDTAHGLARAMAIRGFTITSGLAEGIDAAAHAGALAAPGPTIAVLGTGIDQVYPARNRSLAARVRATGVLLSELPPGTPALAAHFPRRNRLIAALSRAVIVVEAALGSGSLITARLALEIGRDVLAVPGSIHSPLARGCHRLLRDGAGLVETADDVLDAVGPARPGAPMPAGALADRRPDRAPLQAPDPSLDRLLVLLRSGPVHLDRLAEHLDEPVGLVLARVQLLELDGRVRRLEDGRFDRPPG